MGIKKILGKTESRDSMLEEPQSDWDFVGADTQYMTHGLHPYPARMIPQIARRLIEKYSNRDDVVLDPFCGSGGVLVEATLLDRKSFGIDINPLACLLARVKTTPIDPKRLIEEWRRLRECMQEELLAVRFQRHKVETPDFSGVNVSYWFKPYVIEELALIKKNLDTIEDNKVREFFYVCFSNTVRLVSGTRKGEFKLFRMPEEEWKKFRPNVFATFEKKVNECVSKMGEFFDYLNNNGIKARGEIFEADTRKLLTGEFPEEGREKLRSESVNLIVTSPPYGDSRTTVAYGQFSRYSLIWLGYDKEKVLQIDREGLGGQVKNSDLNSEILDGTLKKIRNRDRALEVRSYFVDLNECLEKLYHVLSKSGHACFVLGNRTVNGIKIPADEIIAELGRNIGLRPINIIYRRIPTKRIPWKSSPTNIPGQKVETISKESIIILGKD
jgi:site-specific DNA-methyltransferase (cytosine-N4-specific)